MVSTFPAVAPEQQAQPGGALPRILPSLTGLRFWAALLVVLYHFTSNIGEIPVASDLVRFGRTGVTFFFVLSGFVLTWTYMGRSTSLAVYFWRRIVRIWPLHLATTLVSVMVIVWADHRWSEGLSLTVMMPAFLLIHSWFPQAAVINGGSGASWSLSDEMFFYAIFPFLLVLLASIRRWRVMHLILVLMLGLSVVIWLAIPMDGIGPYSRNNLLSYFPLIRVVQFIAGVAVAVAVRRGWRCPVPVWAAVGIVVAWHAILIPWDNAVERGELLHPHSASQLFALLPFALLIAAVATNDLKGVESHLGRPAFILLGQASFAWYLLHTPGLIAYVHLVGQPESLAHTVFAWVVVGVLTQVLSIVTFLWFERPLERTLRGWMPARVGPQFAPS